MIEVIPAIIAKDYEELREKITKFVGISKIIQIDMCDGRFVPSYSWPMQSQDEKSVATIIDEEEGLPFWDTLDFEFDLMIANADQKFDFFVRLGAKRIIFHLEAEVDLNSFKEFLESIDIYLKENIEIGIAINNNTPIEKIESFINHIDFIQCMGIDNIGFQGQDFNEKVIDQIKNLRQKYKELIISVDGGVNERTASLLVAAGANRLVIGSALMESYNIKEKIQEFESL